MFKKLLIIFSILILSFFVLFFFWGSAAVVPDTDYAKKTVFRVDAAYSVPDTFSLMTYNIGYLSGMTNNRPVERSKTLFDNNLSAINTLFKEGKADVVLFQEIDFDSKRSFNTNQYKAIAQGVGYSYGACVVNWDKRYVPFPYWPIKTHFGRILSGQALLSQYPIYSNERLVLPKPQSNTFIYNAFYLDRLAQLVWIGNHEDSLLIINVHFEAWDIKTREKQARIVLEIFDKYAENYPVILAGDFNCTSPYRQGFENEKTIQLILNHSHISAVVDSVDYVNSPNSYYTFDSESPRGKIDYIFYNHKYLTCVGAQVLHPQSFISDHLPLQAFFIRRPDSLKAKNR